jgi:general secretion pathway protein G
MPRRVLRQNGFTLIEIMLAVAILALLASIAVPMYRGYVAESRIQVAIHELRQIELLLKNFGLDEGVYPDSLAAVGADQMKDPWGRPYQYLNIGDPSNRGHARKDRFLVPVNSDFDLYSLGADGVSAPAFTARGSRDDVVRANNGSFFGLAEDY